MDSIYPVSQRDPKWKSTLLGFNTGSTYTIGGYGCLITAISIVVNHFKKKVIENPETINNKLKEVKGFIGGGLYVWGSIGKIYPELKEVVVNTPLRLTDKHLSLLSDSISKNNPVMLQVDFNPQTALTDMHYVLAIGYNKDDENDITIVDPWDGNVKSLKSYLGTFRVTARQAIEQMVFYSWDGEDVPSDQIEALQKEIKALKEELSDMRDSRNKWKAECAKKETEITLLSGKLKEADSARLQLIEEMRLSKEKIEKLQSNIDALVSNNSQPIKDFSLPQLLSEIWLRLKSGVLK